ncbi:hypothetical protein NQ314_012493 [Rhamnusium bicolor]|uniref:Uncharacterized protein n=1 Tax=Rhamnusium bicolor TaxID=1586634 RepID=A0AAV8XBV6_9CUCU|nr:hypothetical protein NQ314_012493 [Rhamnusium bicolor]
MVKNRVAARNITFKLNDVEGLAREEFSKITVDDWSNLCNHVNKYENEHILDNFTDSLVFSVNTGSSDEDDFGSVFSDSNDSNDGLAGIEPLI